jgi:transcriptional regulator with PAS, ATPase and Fis domain
MVKKRPGRKGIRQLPGGGQQRIKRITSLSVPRHMVDFYKQVARVADADASVLIEGESGTGKELTARSLHQLSVRRDKPFVPVHCGAIPDTLLESELFGYEKGAFTGADRSHAGRLESAQDGTIFLDEITEMSTGLQAKLLRFMQNGEIRRLGGHGSKIVTVRVVAAANRDIDAEIQKGTFRADLLYRFVVRLHIPPLRDHKEALPQLVESLLKKLGYGSIPSHRGGMEMLIATIGPQCARTSNVLQQPSSVPFGLSQQDNLLTVSSRRQENGPTLMTLEGRKGSKSSTA